MSELSGIEGLTDREKDVLTLASRGFTDKEIASALGLSVSTVSSYWMRIRLKLGTNGRAESVAVAMQRAAESEIEHLAAEMEERSRREAKFRALLEAAPDGVVVVDEGHRIVEFNAEAERMFGRSKESVVGQPVTMLIPDRYRESHRKLQEKYFVNPIKRPMGLGLELYGLRGDGIEFPVEISLSPVNTEDGKLVIAVVRAVGEENSVVAGLRQKIRSLESELATLRKLLESANESVTKA